MAKKASKKATKKVTKRVTTKKVTKKAVKKTAPKKAAVKKKSTTSEEGAMVGKTISAFSVVNSQGNVVTQDSFKGHKTVLYFYPKDDTPGCTMEGQQFSALMPKFEALNTKIYGVSKDSAQSHDKFICKFGFKMDLLSDENEKLCKIFDVIHEKNMYGRKYMGIVRSTFVLDENLKVVIEMRKVSPDGHAQEILDFVKSL